MKKSAIIIDPDGVLLLETERRQNQFNVLNTRSLPVAGGQIYSRLGNEVILEESVCGGILDRLREGQNDRLKELSVVIPHGITWHHFLEVEDISRNMNEAHEFVMWKIQRLLPFPKEFAELRLQVLAKEPLSTKLLVVVTFKSFLMKIEKCMGNAGITPSFITTPTIAFMNAFERSLPAAGVLLWLRRKGFSMVYFHRGMPMFIREIDRILDHQRLQTELFGFNAVLRENFGEVQSDTLVFFDELARADIRQYLPENAIELSLKEVIAGEPADIAPYVCALGAL